MTAAASLNCPQCGAPLRWKGPAAVIECKYCQTHVQVQTGQRTNLPAAAVATKPISAAMWIAVAVAVFVTVLGAVIQVAVRHGSAGSTASAAVAPSEIAAVSLVATPTLLAERLGVAARDTVVNVPVEDDAIESATFVWDSEHLEHVSTVALSYRGSVPAGVLERARQQLGRELRPASTGGYQYNGERVNFLYRSSVAVNAHTFDDPRWKERLGALWTVLKAAALGTSDQLSAQDKRDVLNIDNPLQRLNDLPLDADIDAADKVVHRVIPGAVQHEERFRVGLGHPWFQTADLIWENKPQGRLERVNLFYPKEFDFKAQRTDLEGCLAPLYEEPKTTVRDHLAGDVTLAYPAHGGRPRLYVGNQNVGIYLDPDTATERGFRKLLSSLARCGD